jgi:hypothetical protein
MRLLDDPPEDLRASLGIGIAGVTHGADDLASD